MEVNSDITLDGSMVFKMQDHQKSQQSIGDVPIEKPVYLIDGSSFLYRAYYALKPMHAPDGTPVNAVYGFCRMIKRFFDRFDPAYCAVVWDSPGKTVRHEMFANYKATRQSQPTDFSSQKQLVKEFADLIGLHQIAENGVEADDLLAALARDFSKKGIKTIIVTSDKDLSQIVSADIALFDPFKETVRDVIAVENDYGFSIAKIPFFYALIGDTSDNIPGVRGIGEKTAQKLVVQFNSLKDLYENLDKVDNARIKKLLEEGCENAFLSEKLFTLHYPQVNSNLSFFIVDPAQFSAARPFFERLNFSSILKQIDSVKSRRIGGFAESYGYVFTTVTSEEDLIRLCEEVVAQGFCALDTETDGIGTMESQLVGVSVCCKKGQSYYIPLHHVSGERQVAIDRAILHLKRILENPNIKKYLHNAKFDMLVLRNAGIALQGLAFDTMVAAGLIREDGDRIGLKALSEQYFDEVMVSYKEVVTDHKRPNFKYVPFSEATDYAAADAHQTLRLVEPIEGELRAQNEFELYTKIEHPLISVLCDMEFEGIDLDIAVLDEVDSRVSEKLQTIVAQILDLVGMAGGAINLNSPQQVSDLLFNKLHLDPIKKTSGKTGYSTDIEVLQELAKKHPVPGLIITYRELFKLKSTYLDALKEEVNPKTGRIHTTFKQTSVATGRLASSDPNMQNIPVSDDNSFSIRAAFHAPKEKLLVSADYSQIELRVLAYLSQDERLLHAFNAGEDIHAHTASGLFDVSLENVSHDQRQIAKRINFSILYGMTAFGLAKDLNISQKDAKVYIEKYMAQYPGVLSWMERVVAETTENGFVTTLWGRRRHLPGIYEKNQVLYQLARRVAINTKAQGTAADLMKLGMVNLANRFEAELPEAKMLLQIHDELIVAVSQDEVNRAEKIMVDVLQNVVQWNVPLVVTVRSGYTWQDVTK